MSFKTVVNFALISTALAWYPPHHLVDNTAHEYPPYYDPDHTSYPESMTFEGMYDRKKEYDVETHMHFPIKSADELQVPNDYGLQESEPIDYNLHSSHNSNPNEEYIYESESDSKQSSHLTDGCLRCICEASSDCDPQVRCHVEGPNDVNCGPFQINLDYWNAAGSPGADQNDPMDFEECMNDIECSIDTVNGYMERHAKDCDGDGSVSCNDYAMVHKAGHHCNSSWILDTTYWKRFKECFFEYK